MWIQVKELLHLRFLVKGNTHQKLSGVLQPVRKTTFVTVYRLSQSVVSPVTQNQSPVVGTHLIVMEESDFDLHPSQDEILRFPLDREGGQVSVVVPITLRLGITRILRIIVGVVIPMAP